MVATGRWLRTKRMTGRFEKFRKTCIISDMRTSEAIRQAIAAKPGGAVFSAADLRLAGTRAAIDQALLRMMRAGVIVRVARGLYALAGQSVDAQTVARAVAQKTGERVGLAPNAEPNDELVVPTSGVSRTVKAGVHTLKFRRMSQRKVQLASSSKGRVLLTLWNRGVVDLTTTEVKQATVDWLQSDIDSFADLIPVWLYAAIEQSNAPRKSVKLGLSGAYDWSNPNMRDDVLIGKVLEKHKFEDVARLCFFYGVPKVKRVFKRCEFGKMTRACVTRMLGNISKSLRAMEEQASA